MKRKRKRKLEVGQKVRIKTFSKRPSHWNYSGEMDYLMGREVIIKYFYGNRICTSLDIWSFMESDFEIEEPVELLEDSLFEI